MGEETKIIWTDHTFSPWWGCSKVSPGCDHCYAELTAARSKIFNNIWGTKKPKRVFGQKHWNGPAKWNAKAMKDGIRRRVFVASMADVFDKDGPANERERLWNLIKECGGLNWLLLTKRPENIRAYLPVDWGNGYENVWLGVSVENQEMANKRVPILAKIPAKVRFLSCEPLLGLIDFGSVTFTEFIHWIIVGGESGPDARPMHPSWVRSIRDWANNKNIPFLFKQWGEWLPKGMGITFPDDSEMNKTFRDQNDQDHIYYKVGKEVAGRLLDGVEYNGLGIKNY